MEELTVELSPKAIWAIIALERRYYFGSFGNFARDEAEEYALRDGIEEAATAIWDRIDEETRERMKRYGGIE